MCINLKTIVQQKIFNCLRLCESHITGRHFCLHGVADLCRHRNCGEISKFIKTIVKMRSPMGWSAQELVCLCIFLVSTLCLLHFAGFLPGSCRSWSVFGQVLGSDWWTWVTFSGLKWDGLLEFTVECISYVTCEYQIWILSIYFMS